MNPGRLPREPFTVARFLPVFLVAAACLFNLAAYRAELLVDAPRINDDVFHLGLIERMVQARDEGGNPLDTWIGYWGQGFPVLRYYQHLPHLAVVLLHRALGGAVTLGTLFDLTRLLLLTLVPLGFYVGSRRLGASALTAACIALCTPLLGADTGQRHFLGFQPATFLWSGGGLYTQLAAMVIFPIALGSISRAALEGRRYAAAIAWLGATWLSHLVLGYIACLLSLAILLRPEASTQRWRVLLRLTGMFAGVALVAAYLLVPTLLESRWLARSLWEPVEYWDSFGAQRVLAALATGQLLDGARIPALTILAGLGAAWAALSCLPGRRREGDGFAIAALGMSAIALLLYFGRPAWGGLLDLLPFSGSLPFHRFICAVQLGGVLLAGLALSRLAQWFSWSRSPSRAALTVLAALVLLAPAIISTAGFAAKNAQWRKVAAEARAASAADLERVLADFAALDRTKPGRGYAGTSWDWGRDFKLGGANVYHSWSGHGLAAISYMYHTMGLASDLEPSFDPSRRDHFELFNVRYLVVDAADRLPPFARPGRAAPGLVAATVDTTGYFGIVDSVAYLPRGLSDKRALFDFNRAFVASDWHSKGQFIRIGWHEGDAPDAAEDVIAAGSVLAPGGSPGREAPRGAVLSSSGGGDRYSARIRLDDPGYILFRMSYHPNWRAELDDEPAGTTMLAPGYVGVRAAPGEHRLVMTYRPPSWNRALLWAGLAFLVLVAIADRRRRVSR
jgi:MFS family permease